MTNNPIPAARVGVLLLLAAINLQGLFSSPRCEQIRAVDALRLIGGGMLIGAATATFVHCFRTKAHDSV